jgi:hypothetical protein
VAAERRGHVLHARPATVLGEQRRHRWSPVGSPAGAAFTITQRWLDESLASLRDHARAVAAARVLH